MYCLGVFFRTRNISDSEFKMFCKNKNSTGKAYSKINKSLEDCDKSGVCRKLLFKRSVFLLIWTLKSREP